LGIAARKSRANNCFGFRRCPCGRCCLGGCRKRLCYIIKGIIFGCDLSQVIGQSANVGPEVTGMWMWCVHAKFKVYCTFETRPHPIFSILVRTFFLLQDIPRDFLPFSYWDRRGIMFSSRVVARLRPSRRIGQIRFNSTQAPGQAGKPLSPHVSSSPYYLARSRHAEWIDADGLAAWILQDLHTARS